MLKKQKCVFCQIIQGKLPVSVVYEDDVFLIIMDAYPLTPGHVLVIPKQHHQYVGDLKGQDQKRLFELGVVLMNGVCNAGFSNGDSNLLLNDGKHANQTVPHLHLHVIPRSKNDFLKNLPKLVLHITGLFGIQTKRATLDEYARRIRDHSRFS